MKKRRELNSALSLNFVASIIDYYPAYPVCPFYAYA